MSKIFVDQVDPKTATTLTLGTSGDTVDVPSGVTLDISASTLTPPATMPASSGVNLTALNASNLGSGTVPTARLGSGTASSSTVLYGDQTYKAEPGLTGWSTDSGTNDSLVPASASAGVYLGVDAADADHLLDHYEEGTWTPVFNVGSGSVTYSAQVGQYTKIGNYVHCWYKITLNTVSTPGGSGSLSGLPFACGGSLRYQAGNVYQNTFTGAPAWSGINAWMIEGGSTIGQYYGQLTGNSKISDISGNLTSASELWGEVSYNT